MPDAPYAQSNYWLQLAMTAGLGPVLIGRMVARAGSAEAACAMGTKDLREVEGIGPGRATAIAESLKTAPERAAAQMELAAKAGASILTRDHPQYPELLRSIYDPPVVLFCQGELQPRDL